VYGVARLFDLPVHMATLLQAPVSVLALGAVLIGLRAERDGLARAYIMIVGLFLVTPYALNYDLGVLSLLGALMAARAKTQAAQLGYAFVATLGGIVSPVAPLILAVGLSLAAGPHIWAMGRQLPLRRVLAT
jgi:hypothetical protein